MKIKTLLPLGLDRISTHLKFLALFLIAPSVVASNQERADPNGWISFESSKSQIILQATINEQPARVLLDSGAQIYSLTKSFADKAGIKGSKTEHMSMSGASGTAIAPIAEEFSMTIDGQSFPFEGVPILPIDGKSFDFILGRRIFEQSVVQIDYPNHRLRFLSRDVVKFEGNVDVKYGSHGQLLFEAEIDGHSAWLHLDTGNSGGCLLTRRFVFRNDLENYEIDMPAVKYQAATGVGKIKYLQIPDAAIGPYSFSNLLAAYNTNRNDGFDQQYRTARSKVRQHSTEEDGIIGYEAMRHFVVTIDHTGKQVHFYKPDNDNTNVKDSN